MKTDLFARGNRAQYRFGVGALIGLTAWSSQAISGAPIDAGSVARSGKPAAAAALGRMSSAAFTDLTGKPYGRKDILARKATVFLFVSAQCPISNLYSSRANAIAAKYAARNVRMFAVYADSQESRADIARNAQEHGLAFPVVQDSQATLAAAVGAQMTPEAIVVDGEGMVRYRGRVDDNAVATRATTHDLADALDAVITGAPVAHPTLLAVGCAIRRPKKVSTVAGAPTYSRDVAPILRAKCESCHRPGEVAPFTLQDYKQASAWAADIKHYTQNGQMPPWKPAPDYGAFKDVAAHTLTDREKSVLAKWADAGAPSGNPKETPPPGKYVSGWQLGVPDVVLQPESAYHLGADGEDVYRNFVVKTDFPEDRWLRTVECRPGNRSVVHHILTYIDANHLTDKKAGLNTDGEPGFTTSGAGPGFAPSGILTGWAPGNDPGVLPQGVGILLPKGANLVIQVHYHRDGKPETDLTRIGLYFAHGTIDKAVHPNFAINLGFRIPYGDRRYEAAATTGIQEDCHILSVTPHMHLLGREMKVWATLPDGTEKPMVWIKDWDFNWQSTYPLKEPMALPKGSKVHLLAYYDNSDKNPRNPNIAHPRAVTWGEQTNDEMCVAFLAATRDAEHLDIVLPRLSAGK